MPDIGTESLDAAISREITGKRRGVGGAVASGISKEHPRHGYRMVTWLLRSEGWDVNTSKAGAEVVEAGGGQSAP